MRPDPAGSEVKDNKEILERIFRQDRGSCLLRQGLATKFSREFAAPAGDEFHGEPALIGTNKGLDGYLWLVFM